MPSARKPKRRTEEIIKGDGPIADHVLRFKVEFYFATIDKLLSALKERFEDLFEVVSMFDILCPVHFYDKDINEKVEALGDLKKLYLYLQVIYVSNMTCSETF